MNGFRFSDYSGTSTQSSPFERFLKLFSELLIHTSGDVEEAFDWLKELDDEYHLSTAEYNIDDFRKELEERGYLRRGEGSTTLSGKMEQLIRKNAMEHIFGKMHRKSAEGRHPSRWTGTGDDQSTTRRNYRYGDRFENIDFSASLRNAQIRSNTSDFALLPDDLEVVEQEYLVQTATVLMIDISHSMILYGEDRITPAKKVAMALAEMIMTRFKKDTLDIVVFGNDAWEVEVKDLPYLQVGPYHTNTVAGLELAMELLRKKKGMNKQIFMITDGKPTCIIENGDYYQNSFGHDPKIINRTINLAMQCRKLHIPITTFMIANDPYLQAFVSEFTETNKGRAFYAGLDDLGRFVFSNYERNKN
jgi:uncharacterized protein with von Willebrand factor type A (vWA) domain